MIPLSRLGQFRRLRQFGQLKDIIELQYSGHHWFRVLSFEFQFSSFEIQVSIYDLIIRFERFA